MYYRDCTSGWAAEFIREILDNATSSATALELIDRFLSNQCTAEDIAAELHLI